MTRIWWWLVNVLCRLLAADEQDAVRGDLAESGETAWRAFLGVTGLLLRRQAALWTDWRPWVALVAVVVPIGALLSISALALYSFFGQYLWVIRNYRDMDPAILDEIGWSVRQGVMLTVAGSALLAAGSATSGFVLALLSSSTIRVNASLFCLMQFSGVVFVMSMESHRRHNDPSLDFSLLHLLPILVEAVLVLLPAVWGIRKGLQRSKVALH